MFLKFQRKIYYFKNADETENPLLTVSINDNSDMKIT